MQSKNSSSNNDKENILLNIISFLCPIVGLILYFILKKNMNKNYKKCGKFALFGFIIYTILVITILIILYVSLSKVNNSDIAKFSNTLKDEVITIYGNDKVDACYKISDIMPDSGYYGSVKVFNIKGKTKVKTYVSDGSTYLVSEYINGKKNSFNMTTSDRLNLICSDD